MYTYCKCLYVLSLWFSPPLHFFLYCVWNTNFLKISIKSWIYPSSICSLCTVEKKKSCPTTDHRHFHTSFYKRLKVFIFISYVFILLHVHICIWHEIKIIFFLNKLSKPCIKGTSLLTVICNSTLLYIKFLHEHSLFLG